MTLHQLELFQAVARHRSLTRAAEALHLSQPALSVQLKQLEQSLGIKLIYFLGKTFFLTDAGQVLAAQAPRVFGSLRDLRESLEKLKGLQAGELGVGFSLTPAIYFLTPLAIYFRENYPGVAFRPVVENSEEIERQVLNHEIDIGVVGRDVRVEALEARPLSKERLVVVAAPRHPLAGKHVGPRRLSGQRFIFREAGSATRRIAEERLQKLGIDYQTGLELNSFEVIKNAVAAHLGITIISPALCRLEFAAKTLVPIQVRGLRVERNFNLIYRKDRLLSHAARALVSLVGKNFARRHFSGTELFPHKTSSKKIRMPGKISHPLRAHR